MELWNTVSLLLLIALVLNAVYAANSTYCFVTHEIALQPATLQLHLRNVISVQSVIRQWSHE